MGSSSLLDDLYCQEEERWDDQEDDVYCEHGNNIDGTWKVLEQDLLWDDDELVSLFSKEKQQHKSTCEDAVLVVRSEAVDWMLKVSAHYGFSILTSVLAIDYLDRFLSSVYCYYQRENNNNKPWMIQLVSVTCLSLAAKVEETHVPLLLDLQVGETKYVFEAKTIQRMELFLLSTLNWKMHPVTPLSFLDHIMRRLGLKWEFFQQCEKLILSVVADSRFNGYLPSELTTAAMMHIMDQVDPFNAPRYQDQLLNVLQINKENVNECYGLILELQKDQINDYYNGINPHKRKYDHVGSPIGVDDVSFSCDENSNDSWPLLCPPPEPQFKKSRSQNKCMYHLTT